MENITMIAAVGKNLELGKNNDLIWRFKEDLQFFKEQTMGKPMVMGYNTFLSLPGLLPGRKHIVLSFEKLDLGKEVKVVTSMDELLDTIIDYPEVMIIGGATVYAQMLNYSNKLVLTEVEKECNDADSYFPKFNKDEWNREVLNELQENNIKYKHLIYTKKE